MPRQFIGQDGFYPKWTSRNGRWVSQRVLTTAGTTMDQMETLLRPAESHEALLWAPKRKTILESLRPGDADIRRAIYELQHLPLICCRCDWQGKGPFIRFANYRPAHWRLRCPECESMVEPDVDSIDWDKAKQVLVERWIERRRPRLDPPGAAIALHSIAPISDLARWVDEYDPQENELIYVGQQLWASFAECVDQLRAEGSIQVVKPWTKQAGQHFVLSTDAGEPRITCSDSTDGRAIESMISIPDTITRMVSTNCRRIVYK